MRPGDDITDVMQLIGMTEAPPGDYHLTLAGFILFQLHEIPKPGDQVAWAGWWFEVVDMVAGAST